MTAGFEFRVQNLEFRILKYILIVLLFLILHSALFIQTAHAQTSFPASASSSLQPAAYNLPATISPTSPLYTDLLVSNMFHTFSCLAIGQSFIGQPCLTYQITKNAQGAIQSVPMLSQVNLSGGTLGAVTSLIGTLYTNPPVRTVDYLASVGQDLGIVKEAHAQVLGSGASVLSPILQLWQTSRNISYIFMIIVFLVIGLMVMFRNRINPQTVITAQAALPGLVIGLILITFSYFLAGLISDLAFVGTNIVGYYFVSAQGNLTANNLNLTQTISKHNILDIMAPLTGIVGSGDAASLAGSIFDKLGDAQFPVRTVIFWLSNQFLTPLVPTNLSANPWALLIGPAVGLVGGLVANAAISPLLGQFLSFAACLALIYQMIKLLIRLLTAWLTIIFLTITAPFQLLIASLPGRQGIATGWILNILGNILIFPAVVAVIYFVAFILGSTNFSNHCPKDATGNCLLNISALNPTNSNDFPSPVYAAQGTNNIIGTNTFPLFGGIDLSFVQILLAFGALMALPTIPDIVVKAVGRMGQAGQMIGQEIMGGFRQGQGYAQRSGTAGLGFGQNVQKGLTGETNINAQGQLVLTQQGLLRRGPGVISSSKQPGPAGQWIWKKP